MKIKQWGLSGALGLALGCAALVPGTSASARDFLAMGGTTFVMSPSSSPPLLNHEVDGVVWVSTLGDCMIHWEVLVTPPPANSTVWTGNGKFTITTADGDQLTASVVGTFPENLAWGAAGYGVIDINYDIKFTGGTGKFANAHGTAKISHGLAALTDPNAPGYGVLDLTPGLGFYPPNADLITPTSGELTGKACWLMHGNLELPGDNND
jgi:hypothetical protein